MDDFGFEMSLANKTIKDQPLSWKAISFRDPIELWNEHWYGVLLEATITVMLFLILLHAKRRGKGDFYMVIAAMLGPVGLELLPLIPRPGYQLWWYHQGIISFINHRLPLYVMSMYAVLFYVAHGITRRSNLPPLTRSLVTALVGTALNFPHMYVGPKLLFLHLHFDDGVFEDRLLGVPLQQFLVLFLMIFHTSHLYTESIEGLESNDTYGYVCCAVQSGVSAGVYSIVEQYLLYMLVILICNLPTALCTVGALGTLLYLARHELLSLHVESYSFSGWLQPLKRRIFWTVLCMMITATLLPLLVNPEDLQSNSSRIELGPCEIMHDVSNVSPLEIPRRRYVCPEDVQHLEFDFHCVTPTVLRTGVENRVKRYAICGKPWKNPMELVTILGAYHVICAFIIFNIMRLTFHLGNGEKTITANGKTQ